MNKEYRYKGIVVKSIIELYFIFYLEELREAGYVKEWWYEKNTYKLSDSIKLSYKKQLKTKVIQQEEHILEGASCTSDFTILWEPKAYNAFVLTPGIPVKDVRKIPFRISSFVIDDDYVNNSKVELYSEVEIKGPTESTTSSSVSFPYKAKWVYQLYQVYIQKIKPFSYKNTKGILFNDTFWPKKVLEYERYKKDCKWGKANTSKIKFSTKTLEKYEREINK